MIRRHLAIGLALASIGLVSSGSLPAQTPSDPVEDREIQPQPPRTMQGMDDAQFVQTMIAHHQRGIEMARLEEDQGSSYSVKKLATAIRRSEERALNELRRLALRPAGAKPLTPEDTEQQAEMERHGKAMVDRLKEVSGAELDRVFLEQMAQHHRSGIDLAEAADLESPEIERLAETIVEDHRRELAELQRQQGAVSSRN